SPCSPTLRRPCGMIDRAIRQSRSRRGARRRTFEVAVTIGGGSGSGNPPPTPHCSSGGAVIRGGLSPPGGPPPPMRVVLHIRLTTTAARSVVNSLDGGVQWKRY